MKNYLILAVIATAASPIGCRTSDNPMGSKTGREQTEMPAEPRYVGASEPAMPGPTIRFSPPDLTTQIGITPLRVLIDNSGRPVGQKTLDAVVASVRLVTWPERQRVSIDLKAVDAVERRENGYQVFAPATISVRPTSDLESRWYALVVDDLPPGLARESSAAVAKFGVGGVGARFSLASDPRLVRVRKCFSPGGGGKIVLDFSERLVSSSLAGVEVKADPSCTVFVPGTESGTSSSVTALCEKLDRSAPIDLRMGSLLAASGIAIRPEAIPTRLESSSFSQSGECDTIEMGGGLTP